MEHEDNYMQNSQNLLDTVQIASGGGDVGGFVSGNDEIVAGIGSNIVGKFEEHEGHDNAEEWKYIKEVHQSEKQLAMKVDGKDAFAPQEVGNNGNGLGLGLDFVAGLAGGNDFGNGTGGGAHNFGNGHAEAAAGRNLIGDCMQLDGDEAVGIINVDGDFSTTSNTISTPADEDNSAGVADVLQPEMKIEPQQLQLSHELEHEHEREHEHEHEHEHERQAEHALPEFDGKARDDEIEEEEQSSLATSTTNGTSSLSENPLQQNLQQQQLQQQLEYARTARDDVIDDKENADPENRLTTAAHPTLELYIDEMNSQLNPDAKEFVPSFGSPTSPGTGRQFSVGVGEPDPFHCEAEPHPNALPRHLWSGGDEDIVAQSPRKGRDVDMEQISLPGEVEFEIEAAQRPHELESEDDLISNGAVEGEELIGQNNLLPEDGVDFKAHSPASFIDHGPETSVDLDADTVVPPADSKSPAFAQQEENPIEDILNTVQVLPNDSENEEVNDKELLNVEEKENISHSPSTEEMQMNLKNQCHESIKDIPQIPIDMDNAAHMEGSFYMEHTSGDVTITQSTAGFEENLFDNSMPSNTSTANIFDTSIEAALNATAEQEPIRMAVSSLHELGGIDFNQEQFAPRTPTETAEKHNVEETGLVNLEVKMDELLLQSHGNHTMDASDPADDSQMQPPNHGQQAATMQFEQQSFQNDLSPSPASFGLAEELKGTSESQSELEAASEPIPEPLHEVQQQREAEIIESVEAAVPVPDRVVEPVAEPTAVALAAGAVAGAAVAAAAVATKKNESVGKKPLSASGKTVPAAAKPKVGDTKKPVEAKKAVGATTAPRAATAAAARPRTAPAKPLEKKVGATATAAARPATASTTTRKPLTAPRTSAPSAPRTTSSATSRSTLAAKPSANPVRVSPSSAANGARKSAPATTTAAAKPRTAAAPAKPTTLGLSGAAKPKAAIEPRPTLASQLRKVGPATGGIASARSPSKPVAASNGLAGKSPLSSSAAATRTKTVTTTTTTTTRTFTARPAPKTTGSTTMTATRRNLAPGSGTTTTTSTSSIGARKLSPSKPAASGVGKLSSSKSASATTAAALKSKTKETNKPAESLGSPIRRKKPAPPSVPIAGAAPVEPQANGVTTQEEAQQNGDVATPPENHLEAVEAMGPVEGSLVDA